MYSLSLPSSLSLSSPPPFKTIHYPIKKSLLYSSPSFCSESSSCELSSSTLDSILNLTQLEPAFEGILPAVPDSMSDPAGFPNQHNQPSTSGLQSEPSTQPLSPPTVIDCQTTNPITVDTGPAPKKLRLANEEEKHLPTDQDIDDFLDQLHK